MNSNRRVLLFVTCSAGIFLLASFSAYFFSFEWRPFNRVNLVADIVKARPVAGKTDTASKEAVVAPVIIEHKPKEDFNLYNKPHFITDFNTDTAQAALKGFVQKLHDLKAGKQRKVRIAYFGDSMIEGDLLTQTLRKLLQDTFGGDGVGFVPITSNVSKWRITAATDYSDGWTDDNFINSKSTHPYISGHLFHTTNAWVQVCDQTIRHDTAVIEKSLLYGRVIKPSFIRVNNKNISVNTGGPFNRLVLQKDNARSIRITVSDDALPLYGISFESGSGVFVDNFSFRGITGIEFARVDSSMLSLVNEQNPYDLVIFQYGVNLLYRPNDIDFNWYAGMMLPVIRKFRNCFPQSDFLLISTTDRAFRYSGEYRSAIGIDSLIRVQAALAYETGSGFYNQFATMGGANSIVQWVNSKPSLGRKDYVHPNAGGAELLANYFFQAILNDYRKYEPSLK